MPEYSSRVEDAGFEERVASIRRAISGLSVDNRDDINLNDEGDLVGRAEFVLDHVLTVVSSAVPELVPEQQVSDLASALDILKESVSVLGAHTPETNTMTMIRTMSAAVENVTAVILEWPMSEADDWREKATQAAATYRRSIAQHLGGFASEANDLRMLLGHLRADLQELENDTASRVDSEAAVLSEKLAALGGAIDATEARREAAEAQILRSIERADQAISAFQAQFSAAQDQRSSQFSDTLESLRDATTSALNVASEEASVKLSSIQQQVDEAADLVSVFAAAGTANAFSKEAQDQAAAANTWRWVAVILGGVAALVAATLLLGLHEDDRVWESMVGKAAVSLALAAVASYAASQSGRHRRREERARDLELNIVAFGPFIRDLDEAQQSEARAKVVDAIFLREPGGPKQSQDEATLSGDQINLVGKLFDLLKR